MLNSIANCYLGICNVSDPFVMMGKGSGVVAAWWGFIRWVSVSGT